METRVYDRAMRMIEVKNEKGATLRPRFLITLDPVSNPNRIDRTGALVQTQTNSYDANDRILTVCFAASCTLTSGSGLPSSTYRPAGVSHQPAQRRVRSRLLHRAFPRNPGARAIVGV